MMKGKVEKRGTKWSFVIDTGRDDKGKRQQRRFSGYTTRKEAEKAMANKINEVNQGTYVEPTKTTLREYMLSFLEDKKTKVRPGTWKHYAWLVNNHIVPKIGHIHLIKLKPHHIEKFYNGLLLEDNPVSKRTIRHLHSFLKEALDRAVNWDILHKNVVKVIDPPSPTRPDMTVWNEEQMKSFLELARWDRYFLAYFLALTTGMRKGEILGLRWKDIDYENKLLYVNQALTRGNKGYVLNEPKTAAGKRKITLDKETLEALRLHKIQQNKEKLSLGEEWQDHDLVIASSIGTPVNPQNMNRYWYPLLEKAGKHGVPKIRFHDLRHTHASHLLKKGIHIKVVSERLGHASVEITLNTYSHLLPGLQEAAAQQFGESLFDGFITKSI